MNKTKTFINVSRHNIRSKSILNIKQININWKWVIKVNKHINRKNRRHYLFNDVIHITKFDPNNSKIYEKSYTDIFIYYIGQVAIKENVKVYNANPLYLIFRYISRYFEKINWNKYLTLVHTNESKEKIKKYEELWIKIRDLIMSITTNSDDYDYDEKHIKIKFDLDDELPINKTIEIPTITIVGIAIFLGNIKYYPQVFCIKYKWKVKMK